MEQVEFGVSGVEMEQVRIGGGGSSRSVGTLWDSGGKQELLRGRL